MELIDKIKALPDCPGVYLMKDADDHIIYIGKACSLKKRAGSYFNSSAKMLKQKALIQHIKDIDIVITSCEAEALILEAGLIKEYNPRYNVAIKDDKSYPLLKLTLNEQFPRLFIVRRKKKDGAYYCGPYTCAKLLRKAIAFMRKIFPLRVCNIMPNLPCLNYHLRQCYGPCAGKINEREYQIIVDNLRLFLKGKKDDLIKKLSQEMRQEAAKQNYEKAIYLRDQITSLSSIRIAQKRDKTVDQTEELKNTLNLTRLPVLIEGFDVSNIFGHEAVGSMVRFKNGYPDKSKYRRFKIKTVNKIDDYAMIEEIIARRYRGSLTEKIELPDLILIDGGKGHLQCAISKLNALGMNIPVISIAKQFEYIYVQWQAQPLSLPRDSKALKLLIRIRDESHRFALSYHRILRKKQSLISELDNIPGVGKKRKKILLNSLNAISDLKRLSLKQLKDIDGIDEKTARNIIEYWKKY